MGGKEEIKQPEEGLRRVTESVKEKKNEQRQEKRSKGKSHMEANKCQIICLNDIFSNWEGGENVEEAVKLF